MVESRNGRSEDTAVSRKKKGVKKPSRPSQTISRPVIDRRETKTEPQLLSNRDIQMTSDPINNSSLPKKAKSVKISEENILKFMPDNKYVKKSYIIKTMNINDDIEARFLEVKLKILVNNGKIEREMQNGKSYYKRR
nr:hypothetical protein [Candidatus Sigynarchaeum springense]